MNPSTLLLILAGLAAVEVAFRLFFQDPKQAAEPALFLALAPELDGQTGLYLHQWVKKDPDARALEAERGRSQWEATAALRSPCKT